MELLFHPWGTDLIPLRRTIPRRDSTRNQATPVPAQAALILQNYLTGWKRIADHIKQEDKGDAERKGLRHSWTRSLDDC